MPPADRFVSRSESFMQSLRRRPFAVAGLAGGGGLLCGALAVAVLTTSPAQRAETTGSAPVTMAKAESAPLARNASPQPEAARSDGDRSDDNMASADCQEQTWPYIARPCLANETGKSKRGVRMISTDKVADPVISAVEAPPPTVTNRIVKTETAPSPLPPPVVAAGPDAKSAETAAPADTSQPAIQHAMAIATAVPPTARPATVPAVQSALAMGDPHDAVVSEKQSRKRKASKKRHAPADDQLEMSGAPQQARIVERWTEREYSVPSDNGFAERKRVIVIHRAGPRSRSGGSSYIARATSTEY